MLFCWNKQQIKVEIIVVFWIGHLFSISLQNTQTIKPIWYKIGIKLIWMLACLPASQPTWLPTRLPTRTSMNLFQCLFYCFVSLSSLLALHPSISQSAFLEAHLSYCLLCSTYVSLAPYPNVCMSENQSIHPIVRSSVRWSVYPSISLNVDLTECTEKDSKKGYMQAEIER